MNTLENVKQWFIDRDLENGGRLDKQSLKLSEEFGELCAGYLKKNEQLSQGFASKLMCRHNLVRCIGYLKNLGYDFDECFELAYQEIKDRKGRWIDGSFVKEGDLPNELRTKIK